LIKYTCVPSSFDSTTFFIREFVKHCGPKSQQLEDIIHVLEDVFQERMLPLDPIDNLRMVSFEEQVHEGKDDSKEV
jgi:hypothetical protein